MAQNIASRVICICSVRQHTTPRQVTPHANTLAKETPHLPMHPSIHQLMIVSFHTHEHECDATAPRRQRINEPTLLTRDKATDFPPPSHLIRTDDTNTDAPSQEDKTCSRATAA